MKNLTIGRLSDDTVSPVRFSKKTFEMKTIESFKQRFDEMNENGFDEDEMMKLMKEDILLFDFCFGLRDLSDQTVFDRIKKGEKIPFSWEDDYFIIL